MNYENFILFVQQILTLYGFAIIIAGVFGNIFASWICFRPSMRGTPTFIFIGFASISDMLTLFTWNLDHFTVVYFNFTYKSVGFLCKLLESQQYYSLQASAWLLVNKTINLFHTVL